MAPHTSVTLNLISAAFFNSGTISDFQVTIKSLFRPAPTGNGKQEERVSQDVTASLVASSCSSDCKHDVY